MHISLMGTSLYGMMGSGKSTLGRSMALRTGQRFVDTDDLIEARAGKSCKEVIADPELDFAAIQEEVILARPPRPLEIVATGGSAAMYKSIVSHLGLSTIGVYIKRDPEELEVELGPDRIAALNNPDGLSFGDLCQRRSGLYVAAARLILDIPSGETPEESLERLLVLRASVVK